MTGESIAHYKITAKLGQGGMGEVWEARLSSAQEILPRGIYRNYDVAPDGKRLAAVALTETPEAAWRVTFLFHFFDELRRGEASAP